MLDDYEFYTSKLRSYKEAPLYAPTPFTNRQVTLAKNSLKILIATATAGFVLKAMKEMLGRDPTFYDEVMDKLEAELGYQIGSIRQSVRQGRV